jgi:hypothetical protein
MVFFAAGLGRHKAIGTFYANKPRSEKKRGQRLRFRFLGKNCRHRLQYNNLVPAQLPLDPTASLLNDFRLPWSHDVRLMAVRDDFARWFYEDEALRASLMPPNKPHPLNLTSHGGNRPGAAASGLCRLPNRYARHLQ